MSERPPTLPQPVRKIAIVRALHLGDLVLTIPALRALRAGFPEAEITLVGLPWARDFVRRYSAYVDRLVEFPGYPGIAEVPLDPARTERFLEQARAYGYDLAIQMHGDGTASNPFTAALGARYTAGYQQPEQRDVRLDRSLPYVEAEHTIVNSLRLVQALGVPDRGMDLEFPLLEEDCADLDRIPEAREIGRAGFWVGIHPGARPPARRWMPERFAAVADALARRYSARVVLLGGPGEEPLAQAMRTRMQEPALDLVGKTTIGALAAAMSRLSLAVGNDSGPSHIANALDTPSVIIFGAADPKRWMPLDPRRHRFIYKPVGCNPCPYWECPIDHRCLRRVSVDDVLAEVEKALGDIS